MDKLLKDWGNITNEARPKIRYWVPAAAMDENDLREEIRLLHKRGFGGLEVVALLGTPEEIIKGKDGWGTNNWNHMVDIIANETQKLGMTFDLANGPMWPISMPTVKNADDLAALKELTYGVISVQGKERYKGPLPKRKKVSKEGKTELLHVMAYLEKSSGKLEKDSYIDLRDSVKLVNNESYLDISLPKVDENSTWLIFAFYLQPAGQKTAKGEYYVIDHLSKAGVIACEEYWDKIFDKEDKYESMESFFCDSLEYDVTMDWTTQFPVEFEKRRGYSILPFLPFVGMQGTFPENDVPGYIMDDYNTTEMINNDYLETVTSCFCENHLDGLEKMAKKYNKNIRYQVGYNKPIEVERSAKYVSIPENEALGRPAMDYLKTMAAATHLDRKQRHSFECAAEFGHCYGQDCEDLFWWIKRSLMSGMNAQVLHGGSYSGKYQGEYSTDSYMKGIQWPGYEAFGKYVSNNWNRTLSVEEQRMYLDTIARMNTIFQKRTKVDCAIYRSSYQSSGKGDEYCFYNDDGELSQKGFSYETVTDALFDHPNFTIENNTVDPNGVGYKCLIIPKSQYSSMSLLKTIKKMLNAKFPVIWIGDKPKYARYFSEWKDKEDKFNWHELLNSIWDDDDIIHVQNYNEVPNKLIALGIRPNIELNADFPVITATKIDGTKNIKYYAIYAHNEIKYIPESESSIIALFEKDTIKPTYTRPGNESRKTIRVSLEGNGQVYHCNQWTGKTTYLDFENKDGRSIGDISIEEDELVILGLFDYKDGKPESFVKHVKKEIKVDFVELEFVSFEPESDAEKSFLRSGFTKRKEKITIDKLVPWHEISNEYRNFCGKGIYTGTLFITEKNDDYKYVLSLGNVSDTFLVEVNKNKTEYPNQVLNEVDITNEIKVGKNNIKVKVLSNLHNKFEDSMNNSDLHYEIPFDVKNYGIWETDNKKCCLKVIEKYN